MTDRLMTEQHLEFLSFTGGCTGSSESTLLKMPHCWKSHSAAQLYYDVPMKSIEQCIRHVITCSAIAQ